MDKKLINVIDNGMKHFNSHVKVGSVEEADSEILNFSMNTFGKTQIIIVLYQCHISFSL